jgi:hypothetical protein
VHVDETSAVEPLERTGVWEDGELGNLPVGRVATVDVSAGAVALEGALVVPPRARGIVVFAHGSPAGASAPATAPSRARSTRRAWPPC